jgi:hypothetical protein
MYVYKNEQEGEEKHHDYNILTKEVDPWSNFEYVLREENCLLFNRMLSECKENEDCARAANSKDEYFPAESLFMVLLFMILMLQQQKTINEVSDKVSERKKEA